MATKCEAGDIYQEHCDSGMPATCEIRWVPPYLRGTAQAAGTSTGVWHTLRVCTQCRNAIEESLASEPDEWIEVL
jgi:hypothetical protein